MKLLTFVHTLRYLRSRQIFYRLYYKLRKYYRTLIGFSYNYSIPAHAQEVTLLPFPSTRVSFYPPGTFIFLNKTKTFLDKIDWNFMEYGMLWCYNLNYFDYLLQRGLEIDTGLFLIEQFIDTIDQNKIGLEPYPTSLRIINWIKFLSRIKGNNKSESGSIISKVDSSLYAQTEILLDNLEYHLLANHLLENGFALFFSAFYFREKKFYQKAREILLAELEEQILQDGGHFELSPMYHAIILGRLLDCINLVQNNHFFDDNILPYFIDKARKMSGWLTVMCHPDGEISFFNDAALGIALSPGQLIDYAERLGINCNLTRGTDCVFFNESGYARLKKGPAVVILDAAKVGPDYQPGHAHADTLSFEFSFANQRVIVNSGTSSYLNGPARWWQRSTAAHSTVEIDGQNSSEVWASFRVARRARPFDRNWEKNDDNIIFFACHDGYKRLKGQCVHCRKWELSNNALVVQDVIKGSFKQAIARYYLHPDIKVKQTGDNKTLLTLPQGQQLFVFIQKGQLRLVDTEYYPQFGKAIPDKCLEVLFSADTIVVNFKWM
jgi:hypothetical protein